VETSDSNPRASAIWWALGGAAVLSVVVALFVVGVSNYRQRKVMAEIEAGGGLLRTESVAPGWADDPALDFVLRGTDPVVRVRVSRKSMTPEEFRALIDRLKELPELRTLRLGYTRIGDAHLRELKRLPRLTSLDLDSTAVTDAGLPELHALPQLDWLVLDNTAVTDAGMEQLATLPRLEMVSVENTAVTDAGLERLAALPNLDRVYLKGAAVTDEGVRAFQRLRPDVRVNR
jgi:hypothetical protein